MSPKDPRRNRHHFLARHLFAHFAGSDGRVRVYDRVSEWSERQDVPERLAMEKFLYAPGQANEPGQDPKDDAIERWLAQSVDGPAAAPIAHVVGGAGLGDLSQNDRHAIAQFVSVLDMRTPRVRDLVVPVLGKAALDGAADTADTQRSLRSKGLRASRSRIDRVRREQRDSLEGMAKGGWLHFIQSTVGLARMNVKSRRWGLVDVPVGAEFITSDIGIVKSVAGWHEPAKWEPGTLLGRSFWLIPLSPRRALSIEPIAAPETREFSAALVAAINRQMIADARRYVYSCSPLPSADFAGIPREPTQPDAPRLWAQIRV